MRSLSGTVRDLLPGEMSVPIVDAARRARVWLDRARPWGWKHSRLVPREGSTFAVTYLGRPSVAWRAWTCLGLPGGELEPRAPPIGDRAHSALVSELPLPRSLRIPWDLHMVVPLGRRLEEIAAGYDGELRRRLRRLAGRFRLRRVAEPAEVDRINQEMLVPYALARHGDAAHVMSPEDVRRMALRGGGLDVLLEAGTEVACHLGYEVRHREGRAWVTRLFGYPSTVFADARRLRDVNAANAWAAMAWAHASGYDHYDLGACHARPDDGLLQWKRRRGGCPDLLRNEAYFHLRLPRQDVARFLWESPVFAVERGRLTLHVGVPAGPSEDEVGRRFRELAFGGLAAVRVHWAAARATPPAQATCAWLERQSPAPPVVLVESS